MSQSTVTHQLERLDTLVPEDEPVDLPPSEAVVEIPEGIELVRDHDVRVCVEEARQKCVPTSRIADEEAPALDIGDLVSAARCLDQ